MLHPQIHKKYYKQGKSGGFDSCDRPSKLTQIWFKSSFFILYDLEIRWMTPTNNREPFPGYIKLCALFQSQKGSIQVKIGDFLFCVTLKFDGWPRKIIGHLFYATSSFRHHFIAIGQFKLELQSGNAKFGSKLAFFVPCDLDIWPMTLKNNRAPLLCYFKLCASFHSYRSIKTGATVRKCQIRVKIGHFLFCVTLKFDRWSLKTIGHLSYATSIFWHHFIAMGYFKLELQSGNTKFGSKSAIFLAQCDLEIWQLTLKNNRAPGLCCFKLCALFHCHMQI